LDTWLLELFTKLQFLFILKGDLKYEREKKNREEILQNGGGQGQSCIPPQNPAATWLLVPV
jgi:hypothetical protein